MEGRTEWTDGRTDDAKTISLQLRRGITMFGLEWWGRGGVNKFGAISASRKSLDHILRKTDIGSWDQKSKINLIVNKTNLKFVLLGLS